MARIRYALRTNADIPVMVACFAAVAFVAVMAATGVE